MRVFALFPITNRLFDVVDMEPVAVSILILVVAISCLYWLVYVAIDLGKELLFWGFDRLMDVLELCDLRPNIR
jgi:hypothetical protein